MGRIVVSENISLDGVIDDPMGVEGFAHGGWFGRVSDADREAWAELGLEEALTSDAMLVGRRTYEFLAGRWPSRTGEWADRLNGCPKYVVSSTLTQGSWNNTTVLPWEGVARLRDSVPGDVVVPASGQLVRSLLSHGLVDEVRLLVFPFLLGGRHSLFRDGGDQVSLRLAENRKVGESLALLTYEVVGS